MPLQATSGAASYDAFGGGVPVEPNYIESCFSTWLYPSISGDNQIVNNIDLSGKGGLVWIKSRDRASNHYLIDTVRGSSVGDTKSLSSNTTTAQTSGPNLDWLQFNNNGFTAKAVAGGGELGTNTFYGNMASWTFERQAKFFDVVTYTGNGASNREIAHNLGSTPGCIMVKRTDASGNWHVYHVSLPADSGAPLLDTSLLLNSTAQALDYRTFANSTFQTDTIFKLGNANIADINASGGTYVAYLFAHNAGGFGLTGTDNVISCGSFTTNGSGVATVDLGYEPQWVIVKKTNAGDEANAGFWWMQDNMRGYPVRPGNSQYLQANTSDAETFVSGGGLTFPTATGFVFNQNYSGFQNSNFIYIAIRRGPMKVPTSGTSVFAPFNTSVTSNPLSFTSNFPVDFALTRKSNGLSEQIATSRLQGGAYLDTTSTAAEAAPSPPYWTFDSNTQITSKYWNAGFGTVQSMLAFKRAPGTFDEVCYTGTGANRTVAHNLTVVPELVIIKQRNAATDWWVINYPLNGTLQLNNPYPINSPIPTNLSTGATATTFSLGTYSQVNGSGSTYVAFLFATCAGVSKVGSYTGTGTTQTINCGFTAGARFVMIKRADDTGLYTEGWYVWDSARGIVAGNDPYLLLNSTAAEVTNTDFIDTAATGFEISSTAPAAINGSGGTFIFLAIA